MFKPTELFISASAAATIAFSGMPRGEALISANSQKQESTTTSHIFKNTLKNLRIAQEFLPFDPEPTFIPFDPEPTFVPFEPNITLPRTGKPGTFYNPDMGRREWIPDYREEEWRVAEIDNSDLQRNCSSVFPGSVFVYEYGDDFTCRNFDNNTPNGYYDNQPLQKSYLCNVKAANNFQWLVNTRGLNQARFLGGREENNACFSKIGYVGPYSR